MTTTSDVKSTPVLPRTYLPKDILSPFASKRSGPSDALLAFLPVAVAVAELADVLPAPVLVLALGEDALDREACWALLASDPLRIGSFAGGWVRFLFDQSQTLYHIVPVIQCLPLLDDVCLERERSYNTVKFLFCQYETDQSRWTEEHT
jgi:hypothetical protein